MRAGDFRERARFERDPSQQSDAEGLVDDYGNPISEWIEIATVGANLRETPGREALAAGRLESTKTGTLRVRASSLTRGISAVDRVFVRNSYWNIRSEPIQVDDRGMVLEFMIETGGVA